MLKPYLSTLHVLGYLRNALKFIIHLLCSIFIAYKLVICCAIRGEKKKKIMLFEHVVFNVNQISWIGDDMNIIRTYHSLFSLLKK